MSGLGATIGGAAEGVGMTAAGAAEGLGTTTKGLGQTVNKGIVGDRSRRFDDEV